MPAGKVYIITSPDLAREVQRHPKSLSFPWVEAIFGARLAGLSKTGTALMMSNVQGENGEHGLFVDGLRFIIKVLKPGIALEEMNREMVRSVSTTIAEFDNGNNDNIVDLWEWVKHIMILAMTDATYGPQNPYRKPELEKDIW